jgi:RNA methyltransferase, TrmH family
MISKNQIKQIQALHLKKNREQENLFMVEGVKLVNEFVQDKSFEVKSVYATEEYIQQYKNLLNSNNVSYTEVSAEDLKKISLQTNPNQVLAIVVAKDFELNKKLLLSSVTLYLDDIRDPGNLGTIIRIADWFGIKQVICSPNTTEVYNPKTLQASMGAILRTNVVYLPFSELEKYTATELAEVPVYGALLKGENIYTNNLKKGIIVIGNEANGISNEVLQYVSHPITIPAAGNNGSESLNAANACGIICSEFFRQLNFK